MPEPIQRVGIAAASYKPEVRQSVTLLCHALARTERTVLLGPGLEDLRAALGCGDYSVVDLAEVAQADLVISLGGDGTLLSMAHHAAPVGTPMMGVDLGSFGFLAAEPFDLLLGRLDSILAGEYHTEERLMVSARVVRGGRTTSEHCGLNEAVVGKADVRHLVRLYTRVNGEHIATYPADGVIISTPTGSTAYTLSAGGPIVSPRLDCLIIVPICPHTLYSRPLVVEGDAVVDVSATSRGEPAAGVTLTLDGQDAIDLEPGDTAVIQRAPFDACLARIMPDSFYQRLRTKLNWGAER